jgi:hypothetical protein
MLDVTIDHPNAAEYTATPARQKYFRILFPTRNLGQLITQALSMTELRKAFLMATLE